jgi:hypothetical protein
LMSRGVRAKKSAFYFSTYLVHELDAYIDRRCPMITASNT